MSGRYAACVAVVGVFDGKEPRIARVGDCTAFSFGADGFTELFAEDAGMVNLVGAALLDGDVGAVETVEQPSAAIVLCSDGLANDIRTSPALRSWFRQRWQRPLAALAMADSLRYRRQGSHDNHIAVVLWPHPEPDTSDRQQP